MTRARKMVNPRKAQAPIAVTGSRFRDLRVEACSFAGGEASSPGSVLTAGSKTGVLLFLKSGTVEVVRDGVQIASVTCCSPRYQSAAHRHFCLPQSCPAAGIIEGAASRSAARERHRS